MLFIIDVSRLFYKHNNLYLNMNDELKVIFRELEEQGWEPQLCNKPIRSFDAPVMCGEPNIVYGEDDCDSYLVPDGWVMDDSVFCTTVKGDSMIDAKICEGDRVMVKETNSYNDGDVLLVMIDGRYTLKAYFKDKDGIPWLIPQNKAYQAYRLYEHQDIRVRGVVIKVIKQQPHISYNSCIEKVNEVKRKQQKPKVITEEQTIEVIKALAPKIEIARLWYAVFRVMMERKAIDAWDYDTFCILVKNAVPNHQHLPTRLELQRMAVDSFAKPIALWDENNAPVQGKRFNEYLEIAERTKEILNNC